ncbi:MAG: Glu/Leu/Phe/Val dehydrogenase [bacterium]|nr:Glu/Leu/Phe/Val dehydrogenase [bacterium]
MNNLHNFLSDPTENFIKFLKKENIFRFYFIYDAKNDVVKTSHFQLEPIADFLTKEKRDFMHHEGLFFQLCKKYDTLQGAFIHNTHRGQASGGVRYWNYDTLEDYLRDGLRLSKSMTRKNALAGLWWGGGKGVILQNKNLDKYDSTIRTEIYKSYGKLVTSIKGAYVVAEDVGTNVNDMSNIFAATRFATCIPEVLGGSGNPSAMTARGVFSGIEAALFFAKAGGIHNKTVALQGAGHVGEPLIRILLEKGAKRVIACDINFEVVERLKSEIPRDNFLIYKADSTDKSILETDCDILSLCSVGGMLNPTTIPKLKAKIICGGANNQLEDLERDDKAIFEKNIIYVPDFVTNRMGIVNCANEQYGYVDSDPYIENHFSKEWEFSIYRMCLKILETSRQTNVSPAKTACKIADELSMEKHPIFGHRGQKIINSVIDKFC